MSEVDADRSILTTIAGVSFRQDVISRCREGQIVQLIRNPSNTHDRNAIEVHADEQIGFIPRDEADTLALYLDYLGEDSAEATIERLTGGTIDKPTIGVVVDIRVSEALYNIVEDDPDFVAESIITDKRIAEIEASLSKDEVEGYIQSIDDQILDGRYWFEQQSKWEEDQKEKAKKRLGRALESYEEQEIEEKAEEKFFEYREKYAVTASDRQRIRNSLTREDVVHEILFEQEMKKTRDKANEDVQNNREENGKIIVGLTVLLVFIAIAVAIAVN